MYSTVCCNKIPRNRQVDPGSPTRITWSLKRWKLSKPTVFFWNRLYTLNPSISSSKVYPSNKIRQHYRFLLYARIKDRNKTHTPSLFKLIDSHFLDSCYYFLSGFSQCRNRSHLILDDTVRNRNNNRRPAVILSTTLTPLDYSCNLFDPFDSFPRFFFIMEWNILFIYKKKYMQCFSSCMSFKRNKRGPRLVSCAYMQYFNDWWMMIYLEIFSLFIQVTVRK